MPRPLYYENQRLPACYMNFYIANGVVIVPQFGDPADREAEPAQFLDGGLRGGGPDDFLQDVARFRALHGYVAELIG